jgi:hypothetical protein
MPLTTLAEYITAARTQLQDENANTTVVMDEQYRTALLYGMIAHVISRDEEEVSQGMADKYMTRFVSKLLAIAA